jgi:Arginyl-tRNA synthetase
MRQSVNRLISLVLLITFIFGQNSDSYGLATLPASQNITAKREITAALERTNIRPAETPEEISLLAANNASCLLLSSGQYLVTKEVASDDTKLLRAVFHIEIEAIMQIIENNEPEKYRAIKDMVLKYFPPDANRETPVNMYVNNTIASEFEKILLIKEGLLPAAEASQLSPVLLSANNYFTPEFWISQIRHNAIQTAINSGMIFYRTMQSVPIKDISATSIHAQENTESKPLKMKEWSAVIDHMDSGFPEPGGDVCRVIADTLHEMYGEEMPKAATVTTSAEKEHGDYCSNVAFSLAKNLKKNPKIIAQEIADKINSKKSGYICEAKNGFVNFIVSDERLFEYLLALEDATQSSKSLSMPEYDGKRINVEYVSANPTGPLHIGHGRWAVLGSCLANILRFAGADVTEEFYVNDAGKQIENLNLSVEAVRNNQPVPEGGYHGAYIAELAAMDRSIAPEDILLAEQQETLKKLRTTFKIFFSEKQLHKEGKVKEAIEALRRRGFVYEKDGATWFRSADRGDDKDRVLIKKNGEPTYFAADTAYHNEKASRGYDLLVDIWGADHAGAVTRLTEAVKDLNPGQKMEVIIGQMVRLMKDGKPFIMSKRTGKMITVDEVIDEIGVDATRYFLARTTADTPMEFDLDVVKERSEKNPLFYVQYAYARICAIQTKIEEKGIIINKEEPVGELDEFEKELTRKLLEYPQRVRISATYKDPSKVVYYIEELAKSLHRFYTNCPVITDDAKIVWKRYRLINATKDVMKNILDLLGVSAPERMIKTDQIQDVGTSDLNAEQPHDASHSNEALNASGLRAEQAQEAFISDPYDTQSAKVLLFDLLHNAAVQNAVFTLKYDESRLTPSQIDIVKQYAELLRDRYQFDIKVAACSSERGSSEKLINVYRSNKQGNAIGEGHVDVDISEGNIEDYFLRVTGMVNIALAASNIPADAMGADLKTKYGPIVGFIKSQYKLILGDDFVLPDALEETLKAIRYIVLILPKSYRMPADKIEEESRLAKEALVAA